MGDVYPQALDSVYSASRRVTYPDGSALVYVADRPIFRRPGWELATPDRVERVDVRRADYLQWLAEMDNPELAMARLEREGKRMETTEYVDAQAQRKADNLARAQRRARSRVRDIAASNDWQWFVTLTLDAAKVDRYDEKAVTRKLSTWCDNHVRRDGLRYVLVAERHKDGAIHFHGFFGGVPDGWAVDSGTMTHPGHVKPRKPRSKPDRARMLADGWTPVYNLPRWTLGFTTAIPLYGPKAAAVNYVCKYITKEADKVGGRWYYSGGDLRGPDVDFPAVAFDDVATEDNTFAIPALGARVAVLRIDAAGGTTNG